MAKLWQVMDKGWPVSEDPLPGTPSRAELALSLEDGEVDDGPVATEDAYILREGFEVETDSQESLTPRRLEEELAASANADPTPGEIPATQPRPGESPDKSDVASKSEAYGIYDEETYFKVLRAKTMKFGSPESPANSVAEGPSSSPSASMPPPAAPPRRVERTRAEMAQRMERLKDDFRPGSRCLLKLSPARLKYGKELDTVACTVPRNQAVTPSGFSPKISSKRFCLF